MPWTRVAIGMGCAALVAGVAGMSFWIDDGSHYFELAAALTSAGFLTLVTCVLTRVFGSSHGSQDDAFTRGRSMGYDAGFLEGHRTARPVVVPLHAVERGTEDRQVLSTVIGSHVGESSTSPVWGRKPHDSARIGIVAWAGQRRTPLLAGALCLALVGAVFAGALVRRPAPDAVSQVPVSALINRDTPLSGTTPARVGTRTPSRLPGAVVPGAVPAAQVVAGRSSVAGSTVALAPAALPAGTGLALGASAPATTYLPAAAGPAAAPAAVPAATPPAVPLTAAEQTAADAAAAAALTAANAKAAADLTAANAAAAAAATAKAAADAAWAVAHPQP